MRLESRIFVERSSEQVWKFLGDASNVPKWDRGVSEVSVSETSADPGPGFKFDTLADPSRGLNDRGRMSYRIKDVDPAGSCTVELTSRDGNARFFKAAEWRFHVQAAAQGSWIDCAAVFNLRWQYLFMAPLLYMARKAIMIDLELLKRSIEEQ